MTLLSGNAYWRGRLIMVDLLIKIGCLGKKDIYSLSLDSWPSKPVSIWQSWFYLRNGVDTLFGIINSCYGSNLILSSGNTFWRGRLSMADLLIEISCFKKEEYSFRLKSNWAKLVNDRRSTVLRVPCHFELRQFGPLPPAPPPPLPLFPSPPPLPSSPSPPPPPPPWGGQGI